MGFKIHGKIFAGYKGRRAPGIARAVFVPLLTFIIAAFVSLCPAAPAFADAPFPGAGSGADPYQISSAAQLTELADLVNAGEGNYASASYVLTKNVDAGGIWTPIGTKANPFRGTFDGQYHVISNPRYSKEADYIGLFGYIWSGLVKNLGVEGGYFSGGMSGNYIGGIVGYMDYNENAGDNICRITNCYFSGSVSGRGKIGGIAGSLNGHISASYSAASVAGAPDKLGGIVGEFKRGSIKNCYSTGNVSDGSAPGSGGSVDDGELGGIVGGVTSQSTYAPGSVSNCYSTGEIVGYNYVAGIVGNAYNYGIHNSVSLNPKITAKASGYVTGMSGRIFAYYPNNPNTSNNYGPSMAEATTAAFWTDKAKWDASVWNFSEGALPTLKVAFDQTSPDAEDWAYEKGSEQDPYLINTAADLAELARQVNNTATRDAHVGKHYKLTADIDISEFSKGVGGWVPIGINRFNSFRGTFDGGGHKVSGLSIDRRTESTGGDYEGLFGYVYMGTVKNLTVSGAIHGWFESGGIAGYLEGDHRAPGSARIDNCRSEVKVYCWGGHAGGIAGYVFNGAVIENCSSSAIVEAQKDELGGIAGLVKSNSSIKNSYSTSRVTGPVNRVGGIAGAIAANSSIENCYSTGDISGADHLGGIAGYVISSAVRNSYSTGAVYGLADEVYVDGSSYSTSYKDTGGSPELLYIELGDYVGGVAGEVLFGSVVNCYSSGRVKGHKEVGGVVGTLNPGDRVENSVALSPSVTASIGNAGRVVGVVYGDGVLSNNYACSGMTTGAGGALFTGEAGADVTAEQANTANFWASAVKWSADVWAFEDGYLPLLKNLEGQTRTALAENTVEGESDGADAPGASAPSLGSGALAPDLGGSAPAPGIGDDDTDSVVVEPMTLDVPGGTLTVPSDAAVDPATGVATMPSGGAVTLADGKTEIVVPQNTAIDTKTGVITVPDGGAVTLAGGAVKITVPPATVIDAGSGTITVTSPDGGILVLPIELEGSGGDGVEVRVPSGTEIDSKTGVITLPHGGRIVLPGLGEAAGTVGAQSVSAAHGGDLAFAVTAGTTMSPTTGVMTVWNGGEITLPDGSAVTVAPGTTINPFTGEIAQPDASVAALGEEGSEAGGSGGGCDAGFAGLALLAAGAFCATVWKKRG